jgi:Uma2 family endonuclease
MNVGRVRGANLAYIPDVAVIPIELARLASQNRNGLETSTAPLPFVVEVWSPPTGDYDDDEKVPGYQARGDLKIWRVHPYDGTVRIWRRSPDGSYPSEVLTSSKVEISSLAGTFIDLDLVFASSQPE